MKPINTIAVFGDRELEGELRSSLPGFHIQLETPGRVRSLIRGGKVDFVASRFPDGRSNNAVYRHIVSDSSEYGVGALFIASSPKQAFAALDRKISEPGVFVAYEVAELPPMMDLIRERIRRRAESGSQLTVRPAEANLDGHPLIEQATGFLRDRASGRLDAKKVAKLYDEPLKRFSDALSVSQAAVSQTPNSKKYQNFLSYFERAARIIPLLESPGMFATWAKTPNKELKDKAPVDLLFGGAENAQKLVETVEDVLVGQPD